MEKIRDLLSKPLGLIVGAVVGVLIGLAIGLIMGWVIWPVEWKDTLPDTLSQPYKDDYLRMAIDSYAKNQNKDLAKQRWNNIGKDAPEVLARIQKNPGTVSQMDINQFNLVVTGAALPTQVAPAGPSATPAKGQPTVKPATPAAGAATQVPGVMATATAVKPAATTSPSTSKSNLTFILVALCLVTLLVAAALAYLLFFRNRKKGSGAKSTTTAVQPQAEVTQPAGVQEVPVAQFMTTYKLGDDLYDDSFSIDSPTGEFLGECGVGISETIGVGDPKKPTAFEVWLFDKNDIQTITKVLMSAHAYQDQAIRQRLASKGDAIMVEPGMTILLETATLQLEARVVDMTYGQGALPPESFFEQMTLELAIWPKQAA
ncbi:MAG TPA: hypothetical protein VIO61_10300 [Anaerolineaceae bacterium]